MRGQEIRKQALQAGFTELSAQVRHLEQIVQIIDGVSERAHFSQLFFSRPQVLLHFFELGEAFLNILVELQLHLISHRDKLLIHAIADGVEALRGLLIESLKFDLQLLRSEQQRACHLAASLGQSSRLLFPAGSQLLFERASNL